MKLMVLFYLYYLHRRKRIMVASMFFSCLNAFNFTVEEIIAYKEFFRGTLLVGEGKFFY